MVGFRTDSHLKDSLHVYQICSKRFPRKGHLKGTLMCCSETCSRKKNFGVSCCHALTVLLGHHHDGNINSSSLVRFHPQAAGSLVDHHQASPARVPDSESFRKKAAATSANQDVCSFRLYTQRSSHAEHDFAKTSQVHCALEAFALGKASFPLWGNSHEWVGVDVIGSAGGRRRQFPAKGR